MEINATVYTNFKLHVLFPFAIVDL